MVSMHARRATARHRRTLTLLALAGVLLAGGTARAGTQGLPLLVPANTTPPKVSGTPQQGNTLTESHGSWTNSPTSYAYQWRDCDTKGASCVNIAGATGQTYRLSASDVGHTVLVQETASNLFGAGNPAASSHTATVAAPPGSVSFAGTFENGLTPWTSGGGGAQCANYGTASSSPRLRGDLYLDTSTAGQGRYSGKFYLPADTNSSTYPLEACDLDTGSMPLGLGTDSYSGLMVYVPRGWAIANSAFFGVEIAEYHFQNIDGAPISLQLHPDHVTLALQLGGCNNATTTDPGCQYRSNADNTCTPGNGYSCLPGYYAIPPGSFVQGAWNEILLHVHWASNSTGVIQTWYRVAGASSWTAGASVSGHPTVQWDNAKGCCASRYIDLTEAYTAALSAPLTLWLDNQVTATGFGAAAAAMP